jgi:hypothetical protein
LSLALAQAAPPAQAPPLPPASTAHSAVPAAPPAASAGVPPVRSAERRPARGEEGRWITLRGSVHAVAGQTMFLKRDDGGVVVAVDISKLAPGSGPRLRLGSPVTVVVVPVGNKYQATGFEETPAAATSPTNVPPPPGGNPPPPPAGAAR